MASRPSPSPDLPTDPVRFEDRFNESDAVLWNIERDPSLRTTIVAIALLDRAPDWDRLRERIVEVSLAVPRLRQKVVAAPLRLGRPRWQPDDRFDIDYHLRRVRAPAPGDLETVLKLAAPIAMAAFDKDRPLWEFTLVEGLCGERAALIEKIHHCFTDGVGGVKLAALFVDERPDSRHRPDRLVAPASAPAIGRSGPRGIVGATARVTTDNVRFALAVAGHGARLLPRVSAAATRNPLRFGRETARGARSVARLLAPATVPLSPVMRDRGMSRRLEAFDVPLGEMRAAAHAAGGTVNDAFLAAVAEGMRLYHESHSADARSLRVTMPINLRRADDPIGNNRFTPVRFTMPIDARSPDEQMRRLGDISRRWRQEPALPMSDVIAGVLNRLPAAATTALFGSMLKGVDVVATNVPGLGSRVDLAGAEVLAHYAFPPPSGAACGIAFLSHGELGCVGVTIDADAIPDADTLRKCLEAGFARVLTIGEE